MAEIVGAVASGVTLAGLFASCIEIFAIIDTQHNANDDHVVLSTQLKIEQCRLYVWGQRMGLNRSNGRPLSNRKQMADLDGTPFAGIIHEILHKIIFLFENTAQIAKRYGCEKVKPNQILTQAPEGYTTNLDRAGTSNAQQMGQNPSDISRTPSPGPMWPLDCTDAHSFIQQKFHDFRVSNTTRPISKMRLKGRTRWAIGDGQKFRKLITDIRHLVDGLESLSVPLRESEIPSLDEQVNMQMAKISDPDTLSLIQEAASQCHPDLSETASIKLRAIRQTQDYSECNRIPKADAAVEKWMRKQHDLIGVQSNKRHFVSQDTWKRYALQAKSDLDDIARTLYGEGVYSLEDKELDSVKALYWKAVSDALDPRERAYMSMQEKRAKPYNLRRL
ncbi:uncharacterized protein Z518_09650 [Rhinocladiella mackenziei CBS 650.93]|uniref:Rhinocladiella mackenziei CBS 650.93 unplaced genomic scaffold supercont1.8, whole genome shotgun sequence n=1 Tax=Rhinocladiella mackenziei CBS 650.93 TaxID=1442369 RepID=A0A0D2IV54_9EURO|nr:uncharacterized protein Z518_09650 [Rhinocladiella mackenziei CBS 650.93]KIX00585.1 hypothetical protein Z518_09650 [Rhinocladiella mackenziei CBS 650.93]